MDSGGSRGNIIAYFLASGSSRVLNSLQVGEKLVTAHGAENARLMFQTPALNKGLIFKDLIGVEKGVTHSRGIRVGTKVYLPFNKKKPEEGGQTFFYDRYEFKKVMANFADLNDPIRVRGLEADMVTLEALGTVPMFAPFLVRQALERAKIDVDPAYAEIPEEEWEAICAYIRQCFGQILSAVTGASKAKGGALDRLLDKLWELNDLPALQQLARAFGIPPEGCLDSFYAWKGTLYFCYLFEKLQKEVAALVTWLGEAQQLLKLCPPDVRDEIRRSLEALHDEVFNRLRSVEELLGEYQNAFNVLFVAGGSPAPFVHFLTHASSRFIECGIGIGMLQHAYEVWDRLTVTFPKRQTNYAVLDEVIHAVSGVVAGSVG